MSILITGGSGFIGSNLSLELAKNKKVVILDKDEPIVSHDNISFIKGDVRNEFPRLKEIHHLFHMASVVGVDYVALHPLETIETEVLGMIKAVEFARKNDVKKIVYSSSSSIYGDYCINQKTSEISKPSPISAYGKAKLLAESCLAQVKGQYGIDYTILRYFNVYGRFQKEKMVVSKFISSALRNQPLTIYGKGNQTRDFTFIDDVIKSTINLMDDKNANSKVINVGCGNEVSIISMAKMILESISRSTSKIVYNDVPHIRKEYEVSRRFCDCKKLNDLGYYCNTDIKKGIKETIKWMQKENTCY